MVGSGGRERSKEAVGMMALHEALRSVCLNTDWTYSVFWTIRPRPRVRGGNGCKVGDDNGSLMLMWEDGFCRECLDERMNGGEEEKSFSKMSIQLYNYGEGLMGKVASDKCHKWVFKEAEECEPNISNYWQSSFDALPPEWNEQFESGIQTIAVIQAGHGLLQLGSCKIIPEDLHFVLRMRHTFQSLGYQSGVYLSQIFSSTRPAMPVRPPPPLFNWVSRPVSSSPPMLAPPAFQSPARIQMERPIMADHENDDIKWPNGLSFFSALTGQADEAKLLFNPAEAHSGVQNNNSSNNCSNSSNNNNNSGSNPNEFLSLDNCHSNKRSLTLPEQMATSNSVGHRGPNSGEFRNEGGLYSDVMETFLE